MRREYQVPLASSLFFHEQVDLMSVKGGGHDKNLSAGARLGQPASERLKIVYRHRRVRLVMKLFTLKIDLVNERFLFQRVPGWDGAHEAHRTDLRVTA